MAQTTNKNRSLTLCAVWFLNISLIALAQTTQFTYQGKLADGAGPASGQYDLQFQIFAALSGGAALGTVQLEDVQVTNGIFSVKLDFGGTNFNNNGAQFLEISVRPGSQTGVYTVLTPRQQLTSTPYAIKSLNAATADGLSVACVNCVTSSQIASAPAGSASNYVQNTTTQQPGADFNVSGTGTANILNAATQFNIGSNRVLTVSGLFSTNTFVGVQAGNFDPSGNFNSFFGNGSGKFTTTGGNNSFYGSGSGSGTQTGSDNAFFGRNAGLGNSASQNSFFGSFSGTSSNSASGNSFFGYQSGRSNTSGFDNSFFGLNSGFANTTGHANSFFGSQSGPANNGDSNSFFGFDSGFTNTTGSGNSFFGSQSGPANTSGGANSFFGDQSGLRNTTGSANSFFGSVAGLGNTTGSDNSFFGSQSGTSNFQGSNNSFFGSQSGAANLFGSLNSFFGMRSGQSNTSGGFNSFFGEEAGFSNTTGAGNTFIGQSSGVFHTTGNNNSFLGWRSGVSNTVGSSNTFIGESSGESNTIEIRNTFVGAGSNGAAGVSNATALGTLASVTQSNSLVLGSINGVNHANADTNVGIGTTAPISRLHLNSNAASFAVTFTNSANTAGRRGYRLAFDNDRFTFQRADDSGNFAANQVSIDQATGNVGIGTVSPDRTLTVNGTADKPGGGSWDVFSDERLKTIKGSFVSGLAAVMQLQPVRYEYKPDNALGLHSAGEHIGFGAQSVQKVIPEAVSQNEKGYLLVNNDPILWTMLNAIKEQQAMIETLQQENRKLKSRNAETETRIKAIEISVRRMSQVNRRHRKVR